MKHLALALVLFQVTASAQALRFLGYFSPTNEVVTPTNWVANAVIIRHLTNDNLTVNTALTIPNNSVALGTKTTGNYAAGDAEAGAATSGDSATAFFSTGTLEDARIDPAIARLASPAFTGTPTAPTQSAGNNSTRIATTAYVDTAVAGATQTPWTSNIDADGFDLENVGAISGSGSIPTVIANAAEGIQLMGATIISNGATSSALLRLAEDSDNGSNHGTLTVPAALGANRTYTFPDASGVPVLEDNAATLTGKTYDAAGTGNVLKFTSYQDFVFPSRVDGAGTTIVTNDYSSGLWGLATSNGTADTNANYAVFRVGTVPYDLDTSIAMVLKGFSIRVSGTDTDAAQFTIGLWSPASSSAYSPSDFTAFGTFINFDSGSLTSPAANDIFYFSDVTLTGWAAAVTAGRPLIIGIARRNGSNDDSVTIVSGTIASGRTQ